MYLAVVAIWQIFTPTTRVISNNWDQSSRYEPPKSHGIWLFSVNRGSYEFHTIAAKCSSLNFPLSNQRSVCKIRRLFLKCQFKVWVIDCSTLNFVSWYTTSFTSLKFMYNQQKKLCLCIINKQMYQNRCCVLSKGNTCGYQVNVVSLYVCTSITP